MADIISKKTRSEFCEYFVGTTLRHIQTEFDAADILIDETFSPPTSGARRSLVQQYYHTVDFGSWRDVKKILVVYENALLDLEKRMRDDTFEISKKDAERIHKTLVQMLARDGFKYSDGRITRANATTAADDLLATPTAIDANTLHLQIDRIKRSVDDEPDLAIGTSKELLETVCKTILRELGLTIDGSWDVLRLVRETRESLKLMPEDIAEEAKGSEIIKRILGNLGQIVQGVAELRNLYGSGHGKVGGSKGLSSRHARLAASSAIGLATFLLETFEEQKSNRQLRENQVSAQS